MSSTSETTDAGEIGRSIIADLRGEAFFETPALLRDEYPAFYAQLTVFYRQDPASRPCPQRR